MPILRFLLLVFALATLASANSDDLNKGVDALYKGRYIEAAQLLTRAYEVLQRADPPRQIDSDAAAIALVTAYQFLGRLPEAERLVEPMVKRWQEIKTPYLVAAVDRLACVYALQGKFKEAHQLAMQSLEFSRAQFGPDHRTTRNTLSQLANVDVQQNKLAEAAEFLGEALASARRSRATASELVTILTNYGKVKIMQIDIEPAVNLLREAVQLAATMEGEDLASAEASYSLAAAYYHAGHPERSEPLVKAALAKYEMSAGPDTPALAGALMLQGDLAILNHRLGIAEKIFRRTTDILKASFGPDDVETAVSESRLGEIALMSNRPDEAAPSIRHALAIMQRAYPTAHPRLATAYSDFAALLVAQGSYAEAERNYKVALGGFEAIGYKGVPYIRTLESYANLLRRSDKTLSRDLMNRAKALSNSLVQQTAPLGY